MAGSMLSGQGSQPLKSAWCMFKWAGSCNTKSNLSIGFAWCSKQSGSGLGEGHVMHAPCPERGCEPGLLSGTYWCPRINDKALSNDASCLPTTRFFSCCWSQGCSGACSCSCPVECNCCICSVGGYAAGSIMSWTARDQHSSEAGNSRYAFSALIRL